MADSENKIERYVHRVDMVNEERGLKLNINKTETMAVSAIKFHPGVKQI